MTLTLSEVQFNLTQVDFTTLPKPRKNKGVRGQLLELALGIPNSSKLTDMVDGELKSYTKGESIAVTQLKHVIPEIFNNTPFKDSKVGIKLRNTLYVGFDRQNNFLGTAKINYTDNSLISDDFQYISEIIRYRYNMGQQLNTITGLNKILQIRTKDSKPYHPVVWNGHTLKNKGMGFYLTGKYAKSII